MTYRLKTSLAIGLVVSAVAFYFALRPVPFADLLAYLQSINWWWTLPSAAAAMVSAGFRVFRWQIMLRLKGTKGFWMAWHPMMIAFLINCVLPGRLGELARPALIDRRAAVAYGRGLATVVAERMMDLAILLLLFALVVRTVAIDPHLDIPFGSYHLNKNTLMGIAANMAIFSGLLLVFILAAGFDSSRRAAVRLLEAAAVRIAKTGLPGAKRLHQVVFGNLARMLEHAGQGFSLIKSPTRLTACALFGVMMWLANALSFYLLALGCPGLEMGFGMAVTYMVILCFFIALPSAPGFWGLWEAGGVFALYLFGVSSREALGYTLTIHAVQILLTMGVGLVSALMTGVNILAMLKPSPLGPADRERLPG